MRPWSEILELSQHCEATGWDGVYFADHFMPKPGHADGDHPQEEGCKASDHCNCHRRNPLELIEETAQGES